MRYTNSIEIEVGEDQKVIDARKLLCLRDLLYVMAIDLGVPGSYNITINYDISPITGIRRDSKLMYFIKVSLEEI